MATVIKQTAVAETCPVCSSKGRRVALLTVRSLVKATLAATVGEETYRFCGSPACDVVYFSATQSHRRFLRCDLRVPVGQKATERPVQLCYCFDWTTEDLEREFRLTGTTTIPQRIKEKVQQGFCHCETMNPQGTCCLGNVNKAVNEIRAGLAVPSGAAIKPQHGNGERETVGTVCAVPAKPGNRREKGAWWAALGAIATAIIGSACCWLPLLFIVFGFSAVGVGSFFEEYRPFFLTITFVLLGLAWYLTYRSALQRAWMRLIRKRKSLPGVEACCASETPPAATPSCCATEPEPVDCCATQTSSALVPAVRRRFSMSQLNRVMLGVATLLALLFALFPHWFGLILAAGAPSTQSTARDDQQRIVLKVDGMTCEGCATTAQQALRRVPGVTRVHVDYARSEAVVEADKAGSPGPESLIQAVRDAGYDAQVKK
jgi:copper chaperone CopZ